MITPFGKFCRKLRIDNDEKMKDMAQKMGVTTSYLSAIENGKRKIPYDWINKLTKHYELTEQQVNEITGLLFIDSLSEREKLILSEVVNVIYFNDSSDYINGLWNVIRIIVGEEVLESDGFNIKNLYDLLIS